MDQKLTDDTLTREQAIEVAREAGEHPLDHSTERRREAARAGQTAEKVKAMGQRTGEYLTQNVNEYPLAVLLIAGMIGYGLAYLIHTRW